MSLSQSELKKLIKIVSQYVVIYGGGISSSDAALREECDGLIESLESLLGPAKASKNTGTAATLPRKKKDLDAERIRKASSARAAVAELARAKGPSAKSAKTDAAPKSGADGKSSSRAVDKTERKTGAKSVSKTSTTANAPVKKSVSAEAAATKASIASGKGHAAQESPEREAQLPAKAAERKRFAASHLFDAFKLSRLPKYGGFIVCVYFCNEDGYIRFEVIGYENLQDIYPSDETLVFKSVGCKLHAVLEQPNYLAKSVEPVHRSQTHTIPYRFTELVKIACKSLQTIYISKKPIFMPTSFTVYRPSGDDLAVLFYDQADVFENIMDFFILLLRERGRVPTPDARKAGEIIARGIREFKLWMDET